MLEHSRRLAVAVSLAVLLYGCGRSPAVPTPVPAPTRPTSTLSGLVFAMAPAGLAPVAGAQVRLEIGSFRLDATTDPNGFYRMSGLYEGSSAVSTSRDGYDTDTRKVTINGDVRLDIGIVPRVPHTLSGVVFELTPSGRVPVDGVRVHWSDHHVDDFTDATGVFSFSDVFNGVTTLYVSKDGYQEGARQVPINGDTRFEIQLVRR